MEDLNLDAILEARARIRDGILESPCPISIPLSDLTGSVISCKLDYLQRTGSFKERGARNALLLLDEVKARRGVIAASAGNHALGLAYHGHLLEIPVTVVMPRQAPLIKVTTCRRLGARVLQEGESFDEAKAKADALAAAEDLTYIHGFDDPAIIDGQGTLGLEILEQVPDVEAVVLPVGGGGLLAGVARAIKAQKPECKIIGVEPVQAPTLVRALEAGEPVQIQCGATLADGLAVGRIGANAFAQARGLVDRVVQVEEDQIALAILRLLELEKSVVEGAAASTLAAFLSRELPELSGKRVVLALCGGNIDPNVLTRVIEFGLVADGRRTRFTTQISDRPGGLSRFTRLIADAGASVQEIQHDRTFCGPDVSAVNIVCTIETRDHDHIESTLKVLTDAGFKVHPRSPLPN